MNPLLKLLAGFALSAGSHTGGHYQEADELGLPISLNARGLTERYDPRDDTEQARMAGAGYRMQDKMAQVFDESELAPYVRGANALYKAAYLAGAPSMMSSRMVEGGDIGEIKRSKGNTGMEPMLAASALFDVAKVVAPEKLNGYNLYVDQSKSGTPLLTLSGRF